MKYIDLHCDSLYRSRFNGSRHSLYDNSELSVDISRLQSANASAQFFAIFLPPRSLMEKIGFGQYTDAEYIIIIRDAMLQTIWDHPDKVRLIEKFSDLEDAADNGQTGAILTFEDGRAIEGSIEKLRHYYALGIRLISLTWNYENCFGYPNSLDSDQMNLGLKDFANEAINVMNELGILIDVSHLSDGGFWDVLRFSKKPIVASHSNARALTGHPRNLTDEMIRALANVGGVSGLNFAAQFLMPSELNANPEGVKVSRISDMVAHLNHMRNQGGEDFVALGSDFDGISCKLEIKDPSHLHLLDDALDKNGWTTLQREKFWWRNAERVLKEVLV